MDAVGLASNLRYAKESSHHDSREFLCKGPPVEPVDSPFHSPYAGHMNLHVPPDLEAKLNRLAAETGRNADQVALDLLASSVAHDEWFRREVETGRASAREGHLLEHDEVASRIDRRYRA
jgi:predicted transcriptional regulator